MRLVATEYLSLDGVFEEPGHWSGPMFNEEAGQFKWAELQASDALLLGRKTYEGFAAAWPTMKGTGEFGEKMNSMPKYVVSSTLEKTDWTGSILVKGELATEIGKLKDKPGRDLLLSGSGQLLDGLRQASLIDLYRSWCTRSCSARERACSQTGSTRPSSGSRTMRPSTRASSSSSTSLRSRAETLGRSATNDRWHAGCGERPP